MTDGEGWVTLSLLDRAHALTVTLPALGGPAGVEPGAWLFALDPETGSVAPASDSPPGGPSVEAAP